MGVERFFNEYRKSSYTFEQNEIAKALAFWGKRKFSIEQAVLAGVEIEDNFLRQLKSFTSESDQNNEELRDYMAKLQARDSISLYRANYLLGMLYQFTLMLLHIRSPQPPLLRGAKGGSFVTSN